MSGQLESALARAQDMREFLGTDALGWVQTMSISRTQKLSPNDQGAIEVKGEGWSQWSEGPKCPSDLGHLLHELKGCNFRKPVRSRLLFQQPMSQQLALCCRFCLKGYQGDHQRVTGLR